LRQPLRAGQVVIEIDPIPILCLDQIDLPIPSPALDLFFLAWRLFPVVMVLKPYQAINAVFSQTRRARWVVHPTYSVPYGLLANR
jgi:hypothetical protein